MWQMWNTPQIIQKRRCFPGSQSQSQQQVAFPSLPLISCMQRMDGCKSSGERPAKSKKFQKIFGSVAPTNPPDVGPFFTADAALLEPLQQGALFSSWSEDGSSVRHVFMTLDPLNHRLALDWRRGSKTTSEINVMDLKLVLANDAPKGMKAVERNLLSTSELTEANFFTVCYGEWPWEELHLTSDHLRLVQTWVKGLEALIEACRSDTQTKHNAHGSVYMLQCCYLKLYRKHGDRLSPTDALQEFAQVKRWKAKQMVYYILVEDQNLLRQLLHDDGKLLFPSFHAIYLNFVAKRKEHLVSLYQRFSQNRPSMQRSQASRVFLASFVDQPMPNRGRRKSNVETSLMGLVDRFTGSSPSTAVKKMAVTATLCPGAQGEYAADKSVLTLASFRDFLVKTQEMAGVVSLHDTFEIISKCDPLSELMKEGLDNIAEDTVVPPRSFAAYLLSTEGNAVGYARTRGVYQDMTQPLSDYFISSSHNTYLSGHQLHGESSVNMYIMVLNSGCRCIELDCWDGDNGLPIIHHGHTLVTKISFEDVVRVIAKHAFVASPYPLVLSLENHCSIPQQQVMVKVMRREFGPLLLTETVDGCCFPARLPSPEDLKYKILIKHKRVPQDELSGRMSAEPASSTVDLLSVHLDALAPLTPTRPKAHRLRRGSVPGRLSVSALSGLGKEKGQNKKVLQQLRNTSEGSSLPQSSPSSPDHSGIQTRKEYRCSAGEAALTLQHSLESEGEGSKHPSCEDLKFSPRRGRMPLQKQDSTLSIASTTSDDCFASMNSSLSAKPPKKGNELKKKLSWLFSGKKQQRVEDTVEEDGMPKWICMVMADNNQESCNDNVLSRSLDLDFLRQASNGSDATGEGLRSSITDQVAPLSKSSMVPFRNRSRSVSPDNFLAVGKLVSRRRSESTAHRLDVEGKGQICRKSSILSDIGTGANQRCSQTSDGSMLSPFLATQDSVCEDNAFDLPNCKEHSISPPQRESPAPGKRSSLGYMDTVETACSGKSIARELSDIVVYVEPIKFFSFKNASWRSMRCTEMFSMSETTAKKATKKTPFELSEYCSGNISRIYPAPTRINSSNFSPGQFWLHGCQMVALNYQSNDSPMQHNMGLFQLNNNLGYILKPSSLHTRCTQHYLTDSPDNAMVTKFAITFIAAENLSSASSGANSSSAVPPVVDVELIGAPAECYKFKMTATECQGETAMWSQNNTMAFSLLFPEIAIIRFSTAHDSIAYPIQSLQSGYRYVYLVSGGKMASSKAPNIFVRISVDSPGAAADNMDSEHGVGDDDDECVDKVETAVELTEEEQREAGMPLPQVPSLIRLQLERAYNEACQQMRFEEEEGEQDVLQDQAAAQTSYPKVQKGLVLDESPQHTRLRRVNRGISWEVPQVDESAEVKRRKWWKSRKSSKTWACLDRVNATVPTGATQSAPKLSRFSRLKRSLYGTRKESRKLRKHSSCDDVLEGTGREGALATTPQLVAVRGAEGSACWSEWAGSSDVAQGQVHRRAVSHDDLLRRVDWECDPSTCSIATEASTGEVLLKGQMHPWVKGEGTMVRRPRSRLKRLWDSLH